MVMQLAFPVRCSGRVAVVSTSIDDSAKVGATMTRMQTYSTQLSLLSDSSADRSVQRTIHYLGSKLRAIDPIRHAVCAVAPVGQPVCDLFAGSGIVSLALGYHWDVTSVDIQEYSRVLCNGLANVPQNAGDKGAYLCNQANAGSLRSDLRSALAGLLAYEKKCLTEAADGSGGKPLRSA